MTTTPAMPELHRDQIIDLISPLSKNSANHDIEFAYRVIDALATLQAQQSTQGDTPAEMSDAELLDAYNSIDPCNESPQDRLIRRLRAILALRPQSESEARRAAQEQLYAERERHTAEVKRLQAEIGRLQSLRPQAVPMMDDEFVACLVKANCVGVVKMSYDSGPYDVTRPSINASKLKEAFEAHQATKEPKS